MAGQQVPCSHACEHILLQTAAFHYQLTFFNLINNNKHIFKTQNLVPRDYSKRIRTHARMHAQRERERGGTRTHKHSDHTKLKYTQLKTSSKRPICPITGGQCRHNSRTAASVCSLNLCTMHTWCCKRALYRDYFCCCKNAEAAVFRCKVNFVTVAAHCTVKLCSNTILQALQFSNLRIVVPVRLPPSHLSLSVLNRTVVSFLIFDNPGILCVYV